MTYNEFMMWHRKQIGELVVVQSKVYNANDRAVGYQTIGGQLEFCTAPDGDSHYCEVDGVKMLLKDIENIWLCRDFESQKENKPERPKEEPKQKHTNKTGFIQVQRSRRGGGDLLLNASQIKCVKYYSNDESYIEMADGKEYGVEGNFIKIKDKIEEAL